MYHLRYDVYVEEIGRYQSVADHGRRMLYEDVDGQSRISYASIEVHGALSELEAQRISALDGFGEEDAARCLEKSSIIECSAGGVFGEMAFLLERPRSRDVYAATDARILSLSEAQLRTLIASDAAIAAQLLLNVSKMPCLRTVKDA